MRQRQPASSETGRTTRRHRGRRMLQYLLVFVGCVLLAVALVGEKGLMAMLRARADHQALQQSLAAIEAENEQLREEARRLSEDPAAIEDLARRELGLIRPGEKLFIIREASPPRERPRQ